MVTPFILADRAGVALGSVLAYGTEDNPIPYAPPAGANWNLYSGVWKLYYKGALIGNKDGFDQSIIDSINAKTTTRRLPR